MDPTIRRTFNLNLDGAVVVLDEAHNIEDTLCEIGSGDFGEIDLCHLINKLTLYSNGRMKRGSVVRILGSGNEEKLSLVAHELLLFLEKVVMYMQAERQKFETGPSESFLGLVLL